MKALFIIILIFICINSVSQDTLPKIKIFKTWVKPLNVKTKSVGVLYQLKDSSILISNSLIEYDYYNNNFGVREFNINSIKKLKLRRKGRVGRAAWIGALSGFTIGAIAGIIAGVNEADDPYGGEIVLGGGYGIAGGLLGALYGAGFGALFGSIKISIPINGQLNNYYKNYSKLEKRAIKKMKRNTTSD